MIAKKKSKKGQKIFAELLGWFTDAPFGTDEIFNKIADADNAYYLVERANIQIFVTITKNFIESKIMTERIAANRFELDNYMFQKSAYKIEK